jgi:multidrug efflux system outer membrane protein
MNRAASLVALLLLLSLCGCKVGPNYQRPGVTLPDQYRQLAPPVSQSTATPAFGEMKWWSVFQDKTLEALIREALVNNYDIRIAASRVVQARAALGVTRADQFPQVSGSAGIEQVRSGTYPGGPTFDTLAIQASYILDFWGQYRRAT